MLLAVLMFVFFALVAKVILAAAVLYLLLPQRERCACCDGDTFATTAPPGCRWLFRLVRLESRWCARCGTTELSRAAPAPLLWVGESYTPPPSLPARARPLQ